MTVFDWDPKRSSYLGLLAFPEADAPAAGRAGSRGPAADGGRTLRSDFLGEFQNHPVLQDSEYPYHFRYRPTSVDPMPLRNFPEIIQGPARLAGLQLDDGLVEAMVNDTGTRDTLPLLAFILRRLYERYGNDGRLTADEYESLGRLEEKPNESLQRRTQPGRPRSATRFLHAGHGAD